MLIIGHRGAKGLAPENTIAGLKAALEHKVDGIEIDVRVTADNVPILWHDGSLQGARIKRTDYKRLKQLQPELTTLDEALRFVKGRAPVIIEVKPGVSMPHIIETIEDRIRNGWPLAHISLASFDFQILRQARQLLPELTVIVNEKWSGVRATRRARRLGTSFITMNQRWLWSGFIRSVAQNDFKLSAYTLNDPVKARRWCERGLHAVITDFPDRFHDA